MFAIGSYVIYRSEGVCRVTDVREEKFGAIGGAEKYYILTPVSDPKSTVFVPTNNERLVSMMRHLLSAEEIGALCASLREERMEWIADNRARNNAFRDLLAIGDRRELIVLLNTVTEHIEEAVAAGKKPTATDEYARKQAAKLLLDEFCATSAIADEIELLAIVRGELAPTPIEREFLVN